MYQYRLPSAIFLTSLLSFTQAASAHTNSIGYENAGPGAVTFWYGSWHSNTNFTEGSLQVTGPNNYNTTQAFTTVVQNKPAGLIDGTTNFYSDGTQLVGTPDPNGTYAWQGATLSGLSQGTYTFTYIPIQFPTATWDPVDNIILSSSVFLSAAIVGGGKFQDNSNSTSYGAAGMLDDLNGNVGGPMGAAIQALEDLSEEEQYQALQTIAPETSHALNHASAQIITGALDSVATRLDSIRSLGYTTAAADRLSRGEELEVADAGDLSGILSGAGKRHSFWSKAFGSYGRQGADRGFAGYDAKTGGMSFGADTLLDSDWVVGGAFTYAATRVDMNNFRNGDDANIHSYQATAYGSRDFGKWYVEGMAAFAHQTFTTERNTGLTGVAEGDFDGQHYAARVTAGMPLPLDGKLTLTPSLGVEYNHLRQSSYTEIGGGPFGMTMDDVSANRLRSVAQVKLATEKVVDGYKLVPSVHAGWRHEFKNDGIDATSTFTGGGGAFTTPGQDLQRNTLNLGGKLSVSQTQDFTLSVQLDTEIASDYKGYAGQILGQWRF